MKWIRSMLVAVLMLQMGYVPCAAQESVSRKDEIASLGVITGARVRLTLSRKLSFLLGPKRVVGTLAVLESDTIVVDKSGEQARIPLASVTRLEVDTGKRAGNSVLLGLVVGMGLGVAMGFAAGDDDEPSGLFSDNPSFFPTAKDKAILLGNLFGVTGLSVGYKVGKSQMWKAVPLDNLRLGLSSGRNGRPQLSASFAF